MERMRRVIREVLSWAFTILFAFLIFILLNSKVFAKVQVQQSSMENTLFNNQQVLVDKLSYNFEEPKKGDIIIFLENKEKGTIMEETLSILNSIASRFDRNKDVIETDSRLVKRVIGTAGDEVDIKDGYVFVNGNKLEETYVKGETIGRELKFPVKVGENKLFVLGDNRVYSKDSRDFGLIDLRQVEGKVVYRVYPFTKIGKIK